MIKDNEIRKLRQKKKDDAQFDAIVIKVLIVDKWNLK